jgi:hypothetical protein
LCTSLAEKNEGPYDLSVKEAAFFFFFFNIYIKVGLAPHTCAPKRGAATGEARLTPHLKKEKK